MENGRKIETKEEQEMWKQAYKIGMQNGWMNGEFAKEDGYFIVEEDRLNKNSCFVIDDINNLETFFKTGNWCLGQTVLYKNLAFMQQVNGGDEWLTLKMFSDGKMRSFESCSMGLIAEDDGSEKFKKFVKGLTKAILFKTKREFVKYDKQGNIERDNDGMALMEQKSCNQFSYGKYIAKDYSILDGDKLIAE